MSVCFSVTLVDRVETNKHLLTFRRTEEHVLTTYSSTLSDSKMSSHSEDTTAINNNNEQKTPASAAVTDTRYLRGVCARYVAIAL